MTPAKLLAGVALVAGLVACGNTAPNQAIATDSSAPTLTTREPSPQARPLEATENDSIPLVLVQFLDSITPLTKTNRTILRLASFPGRYIVSQLFPVPEGWVAYHLALVQINGTSVNIVGLGPALGDQDWLTPMVWEAHGRALVLADQGSEYSWGLQAYVITSAGLTRDTTFPEVAKIDQQNPMGPSDDALPYVRVAADTNGFRVSFGIDLLQDPGGRHQITLCRTRADSIVFTESASGWVRQGAIERKFPEIGTTAACS